MAQHTHTTLLAAAITLGEVGIVAQVEVTISKSAVAPTPERYFGWFSR